MKDLDKLIKIQNALKNTIVAKNNSTDFLYHLKNEFPDYKDIKKYFNNIFDKEFLKEIGILKEEKSEIDKRKIEYRLDELHKLYKEYVNICKSLNNLGCHKIIETIIVNVFFESYTQYDYDILKKIKKQLKNIFAPKTKEREMFKCMSSSPLTFNTEDILFSIAEESLNFDKLNKEINFILKLIKSTINLA